MDRRTIALLTTGHCCIDFCQAVVPALVPFLVKDEGLSGAAAGGMILASSLASSVVQPVFGRIADRTAIPWLLPASLLTTVLGLVAAALAPVYETMLAALAVSSLGVAAFHPEAARLVNFAAGERHATGMSIFSVGGSLGFALAPLVTTGLMVTLGRRGLVLLLVPVALTALWFLTERGRLIALAQHRTLRATTLPTMPGQWGPFAVLGLAVAVRSAVGAGLLSFLALYWMHEFGASAEAGNMALAVLMTAGIAGALLGGWLADRWGRRAILRSGLFGTAGLLALLGACDAPAAALAVVAALGLVLATSAGVQVVLGQEYLPSHLGTASGVTIGLAVSCGGLAAPILGRATDLHGLAILPRLLAALALAAGVLACVLPQPRSRRSPETAK